jgi:hypothetical protein
MSNLDKTVGSVILPTRRWTLGLFVLIQVGVMLLAISNESLWIDEFWTAHFGTLESLGHLYDLLLIPGGSQTPLHFVYYYFWALFFHPNELFLRLANLPFFVLGQLSLLLALRTYRRKFSYLFLAVCALHPMVWQYANEARPYIMMYAGSQMILAYILRLHARDPNVDRTSPLFSAVFVAGGILLFGASMLGAFWVFTACVYITYFHYRYLNWRYLTHGVYPLLAIVFLATTTLLTIYYVSNVINGGGASRLSPTTMVTVLSAVYELLGLSGIGPSRLVLRDTGLAAFGPYWIRLIAAGAIVLAILSIGLKETTRFRGARELIFIGVLWLLPIAIVVISGFVMHWRVLGRHLIAALPILNILFALGLAELFETHSRRGQAFRSLVAVAFLLVMIYSSCSLRFSERHRKDDYRAAAAVAQQSASQGKRVWWAADYVGANYYRLPGEFDFMGVITGVDKLVECIDRPGVQAISNVSRECLQTLSPPDVVILSKPDLFDRSGEIAEYLKARNFEKVQVLPAFTIWRSSGHAEHGP